MICFFTSESQKSLLASIGLSIIALFFSSNILFAAEIIFDKEHSPYHINSTLTIGENDSLIILEGTTIIIDTVVDIIVNGTMFIRGTASEPVKILPKVEIIGWGQIKLLKKASHCSFEHAEIVDGTVIAIEVHLVFRYIYFINRQQLPNNHNITRVNRGSADLQNCSIEGPGKGEGFLLKNMNKAIIRNCTFSNIPDAIECVRIKNSRISNNLLVNIPDDAIDLNNCTDVIIDSNIIIHAHDRGLEIGSEIFGPSENIMVHRNLIVNCKEGITFKEGSSGIIINNTLFQNNYGVVCVELVDGKGGSKVEIENTIISQSRVSTIKTDSLSEVLINYSLSDKCKMNGRGNLFENPQFSNPIIYDFSLNITSPCIEAGKPDTLSEPDSPVSNIGAY